MTPAQRKALLEQAKALMNQAEADDTPAAPAQTIAEAQAQGAASVKLPAGAPPLNGTPAISVPLPVTGPGGDTRVSGQPSLAATMRQVWANMKAASTPKKVS